MHIKIVGTGVIGLVTGATLAEIGHKVTCVDSDKKKIADLQQGIISIFEPGLEELVTRNLHKGTLAFTNELKEENERELYIVTVGTPANEDGSVNLTMVESACVSIASIAADKALIAIKSTVPPGTCQNVQKKLNKLYPAKQFHIMANPEFLRTGAAIHDMYHADRVIIGANDVTAAQALAEVYQAFAVPIVHTDVESAEMIKYTANAFLATKISFINEIANVCGKVGANIDDVVKGIGFDHRIGTEFFQAGIGYGGSCFPKDTKALAYVGKQAGEQLQIVEATITINEQQRFRLLSQVKNVLGNMQGKKIAILGLAFKANTSDMREAPSVTIIQELLKEQADIYCYDPQAVETARDILGNDITYGQTMNEVLIEADAAIICTDWDEFKTFPTSSWKVLMKNAIIFDGRNCLNYLELKANDICYFGVGR
jgi:UDPglucose 6-dehydrogenase